MADTDTPTRIKRAKPPGSETRETLTFFLKLALIVFVLRSFIVAPFSIPSQSMLPRLYIGDGGGDRLGATCCARGAAVARTGFR